MADSNSRNDEQRGRVRFFGVAGGIGLLLLIAFTVHTVMISREFGSPGASKVAGTVPAEQSGESAVGKNDSGGQEDATGGRARAIKGSAGPSSVTEDQRAKVKKIISTQQDPPRADNVGFEMMIGTAVPRQANLQNVPSQIAQILNGYQGSQYILVHDKLVVVDQQSRRVIAIVSGVA